jgi:hypothetical protein
LGGNILNEGDLPGQQKAETENKLRESERSFILFVKENDSYQSLRVKLKTSLQKLEGNDPTSKLWVQYFRMCTLVKLFIQAERESDWNFHV